MSLQPITDMLNFKPETKTQACDIHGEYESTSFGTSRNVYWSPCPTCSQEREALQKRIEAEKEAQRQVEILNRRLDDMGVPKRYRGLSLDNYSPTKDQVRAHGSAISFVENFSVDDSQVLILCGNTGTGKTRLASALMQTLDFGLYIRAIDISRQVRASYSKKDVSEIDVIDYFVSQQLLVIDELGVQRQTEDESMLITDLIDRRYADLKSTVIISNYNKTRMAEIFGARAWDRINQDAITEPMTGETLRVNQEAK